MDQKFKFTIPAILEKNENSKEFRIWGLASTPNRDSQGEVVKVDGLDVSPIEKGKGLINWDHKRDPKYIIGALDKYKKTDDGLYLGGYQFKDHDQAKAVQQIMTSLKDTDKGRLGMSVEGVIKKREGKDEKTISKAVVTAVALTLNPVNSDTYVNIAKAHSVDLDLFKSASEVEFSEIEPGTMFTADQVMALLKSLGVGAGYATSTPVQLTGGDALATEDLDHDTTTVDHDEEKPKSKKKLRKMSKSLYKSTMKELLEQAKKLHPEADSSELWETIKERLGKKFQTRLPG